MVAQRRIGPLVVVFVLLVGIVLARAFQVQVLEHEIWASEALDMVHGSERVPSHRGRILDARGAVIAEDEDHWQLTFRYREFRRGNPLAQLAHARSSLEMRAVSLPQTLINLRSWAIELVALSPHALREFANGKSLPGTLDAELSTTEAREALRERRASDLRFYAAELLNLPVRSRRIFQPEPESPDWQRSLLDLAARARGSSPEVLLAELEARLSRTREELAQLAELLERDGSARTPAGAGRATQGSAASLRLAGGGALDRLLEDLESARSAIEDQTADALFVEACGFDPGRLETRTLERWIDTAWIGRALRWDDARRRTWLASRRAAWERALEETLLPRVLVRAELEEIADRRADALLSELALLWTAPRTTQRGKDGRAPSWLELDDVLIATELPTLLQIPKEADAPQFESSTLVFCDEALRELARASTDRWGVLGAACDLSRHPEVDRAARTDAWQPPAGPVEAGERWRQLFERGRRVDELAARRELLWWARGVEARFQNRIAAALERALGTHAPRHSLELDANRLSRAEAAERFLAKDLSSRSMLACERPSWELVRLVSRHQSLYAGFELEATTQRVYRALNDAGRPLAASLIGELRRPTLVDLLAQGQLRARQAELRAMLVRSESEDEELRTLSGQLLGSEEWIGGTGIEAYFDAELRGQHGYAETFSLAEEERLDGLQLERAPKDGSELALTLDLGLQRAAEDCLQHPQLPAGPSSDQLWVRDPVGAIVLARLDGEVLVAASEPGQGGGTPSPGRSRERAHVRERTLTRPTFNPPGSSFKPFIAAFALAKLGLNPERRFACVPLPDGGAGWKTMHCHGSAHGELALRSALARSCNAYFAHLAEELYTPEQLLEAAAQFGFGEPTGVRHLGLQGRSGLMENARLARADALVEDLEDRASAMRFANGLGRMEANPMQLARAMAGLVRGELPQMRLVRSIDRVEVQKSTRPLDCDEQARRTVLEALDAVVNEPGGTAYDKGLDAASLGFRFACKTGSADWARFVDSPELAPEDRAEMAAGKLRKHTWVAGFFPEDQPRFVLVVYLHDVSQTASHTAVYLAAQFLKTAAVRSLVAEGQR
jgi:cell division protein FtsI/penicillin-binding protein 2